MKISSAILIVTLLCLNSICGDGCLNDYEFTEKMDYFYVAPSRADFDRYKEIISKHIAIMRKPNLLAVTIARISEKHSWPITMENSVGSKAKEILEGKSEFAKYINDDEKVDADKLDVWWLSYFATGETQYLDKLLLYAGEKGAGTVSRQKLHAMPREDSFKLVLHDAASWSFKSNCEQHESIAAYASKCLDMPKYEHKIAFLKDCVKGSLEGAEKEAMQCVAPRAKWPDYNESTTVNIDNVEEVIKWAENGELSYTLALYWFFSDCREQLKWARLARKQAGEIVSRRDLTSYLDKEDWDLEISRLDTSISRLEEELLTYDRDEEDILPDLQLAEEGNWEKINFLFSYYANRHEYEKALYWLEKSKLAAIKKATGNAPRKDIANILRSDYNKMYDQSKWMLLKEKEIMEFLNGGNP